MTFEANPTGFLDVSLKSMADAKTQRPWAARCSRKVARGSASPGAKQEVALCGVGALRPSRMIGERGELCG